MWLEIKTDLMWVVGGGGGGGWWWVVVVVGVEGENRNKLGACQYIDSTDWTPWTDWTSPIELENNPGMGGTVS